MARTNTRQRRALGSRDGLFVTTSHKDPLFLVEKKAAENLKPGLGARVLNELIDTPVHYRKRERLNRDPMPKGRGHRKQIKRLGHHYGTGYKRYHKVSLPKRRNGYTIKIQSTRPFHPLLTDVAFEFLGEKIEEWIFGAFKREGTRRTRALGGASAVFGGGS